MGWDPSFAQLHGRLKGTGVRFWGLHWRTNLGDQSVSLADFGEEHEGKWYGSFLPPVEVQGDQRISGVQLEKSLVGSEPVDWG